MNAHPAILRASVAADGRLISADAPILALQREAGGALGEMLAVPALAAVARLVTRLGIMVSRPVVAAGLTHDVDMWVRARPDAGGVAMAIVDWRERPAAGPMGEEAERQASFAASAEGWIWQVDPAMRFTLCLPGEGPDGALPDPAPVAGMAFTRMFTLLPDADGDLAILGAFARRQPFERQHASLRQGGGAAVLLSGFPLFDAMGRLMGYRGHAAPDRGHAAPDRSDEAEAATGAEGAEPMVGVDFSRRLDRSLRLPLGRIIANADSIAAQMDGPLRPDYAGYATDIASAGRHLMALIDDLADLQAIDRPDFAVAREEVDLADVARRAAGLLGVRALDRKIRIDPPDMDEAMPAIGEFRRVLQILVNLVGNAVRYSPDGSQIWLRVDGDEAEARVTVADQGPGIAADMQDRIFDKFERLGRDDAGGSGLGLYISRRLARAMGGDISIESAPGQGARFTLSLPTG
ncbi:signal transduction histidine kinase [Sphingobium fontiphilum]|uniref:histidine kinase n=2 Tax=Sphingobium fontiphilum TaxID=944425 RepID=A0A7W6DHW6_9SPHN|nr:HAMP domain-containing sensor histidine kinase [Sphingobium fontiphilum]MBB3980892.1 signal transduction histidine kinase [Sphingobium fontiphilum]